MYAEILVSIILHTNVMSASNWTGCMIGFSSVVLQVNYRRWIGSAHVESQKCESSTLLGGGTTRPGKRFARKVPLDIIADHYCTISTASNVSYSHYHEGGVFGILASKIGWKNNVKNRLYLKLIVSKYLTLNRNIHTTRVVMGTM